MTSALAPSRVADVTKTTALTVVSEMSQHPILSYTLQAGATWCRQAYHRLRLNQREMVRRVNINSKVVCYPRFRDDHDHFWEHNSRPRKENTIVTVVFTVVVTGVPYTSEVVQ